MDLRRIAPLLTAVALTGFVMGSALPVHGQAARDRQPAPLNQLTLPPGFHISVYADDVPDARAMVLGTKGTLFVGSRSAGKIYALLDRNGDKKIDEVKVIASGLRNPAGLAFRDGALYASAITRIIRFDDIEDKLDAPPAPVTVYDQIPDADTHNWRYLAFGPDGLLYVSVGAPCNICEPPGPNFASILRMKPDGTGVENFAHGVRDSVGFDWNPATHDLWFTDNGRDLLGDDVPNDELNVAWKPGLDFGYPYCHQGDVSDPEFGSKKPCSATEPPAEKMGPHVAAIGMKFYTGTMFPAAYRGAIIIAQHGSWNRSQPIGYRVMVAHVSGRKVTSYEPFIQGFLQGTAGSQGTRTTGAAFGRPVDVLVLPDGSVLVSDDTGGRIFRVTYTP